MFDLETTDLSAVGAGVLLCAVIKPLGKQEKVFRLDEYHCRPGNEAPLVKDVIHALSQFDMWVGHNIERFDIKFLKSRAFQLGLPFHVYPVTYDTLRAFGRAGYLTRQNAFGKPSKGLGHVADFLKLKQEKTAIFPREWWESIWGDFKARRAAMDKIVSHCRADTIMNEKAYRALLSEDMKMSLKRLL